MKQILCIFSGIIAFFFACIPLLCYRIINTGIIVLFLLSLLCFSSAILSRQTLQKRSVFHIIYHVINKILIISIVFGTCISIIMIHTAWNHPPQKENTHTMIVLGCQVIDTKPSLMLKQRLNRALSYALQNPTIPIIVSGGLDTGETLTEALVMKQYLVNHGIPSQQIYLEDQSYNTEQNIRYSKQIIDSSHLSENIIIVSNEFHQLRACVYANQFDLNISCLSARTSWKLLPSYWVREWFGLVKAVFLTP